MSNWSSLFAMHLQKLRVREILPQNKDGEIHINEAAGNTFIHGQVHFEERVGNEPGHGVGLEKEYVDEADDEIKATYLPLEGGLNHKVTGTIHLEGNRKIDALWGESGKLSYDGGERIKWGNNYVWLSRPIDMQDNAVINVPLPEEDGDVANKKYVDENAGGVPVGSIMFWLNATPPKGWRKLHGGTFDVEENPELHKYLEATEGYTSGHLPNWSGKYPVEYGGHATENLGSFVESQTKLPSDIKAETTSIPDGSTRTFSKGGGTNAYSDGISKITVKISGGDSVTRPPSVVGHYILKPD